MRQPPYSIYVAAALDFSDVRSLTVDGESTLVVTQFNAYCGAPSAIERSALVVIDNFSDVTCWEAHVDALGDGTPQYRSQEGRWIWSMLGEGPFHPFDVVATTGSWDFFCSGFLLQGVNPAFPLTFAAP